MNFLGTFIAILLALYLTGNIQDGSVIASLIGDSTVIHNIVVFAGLAIVAVFVVIAAFAIRFYGASPRKLWNDFKSGKMKF